MFPRSATPGSEIEGAGGAYVRRRFTFGERDMVAGDMLKAEELSSIPPANLHSLINLSLIELFPKASSEEVMELRSKIKEQQTEIAHLSGLLSERTTPPLADGDCFLMSDETGKRFHVVKGRQMTVEPLTRAQATAKMKELS